MAGTTMRTSILDKREDHKGGGRMQPTKKMQRKKKQRMMLINKERRRRSPKEYTYHGIGGDVGIIYYSWR